MDATNKKQGFYDYAAENNGPRRGAQVGNYWLSLSYNTGRPRQYYLSVDDGEGFEITNRDLSVPLNFRMWCLNNGFNPPIFKDKEFLPIMQGLIESATERDEPLPILRTDAEHIENLVRYFHIQIPNQVRSFGQEFLDGKVGDIIRIKIDVRRIYFKWQRLKDHLQNRGIRNQHIKEMRTFIADKGEYLDEKSERGWFRCTYWIPMDLFDEVTLQKWINPDEREE